MIKGNRVIEQTKQMILVNYSLDQLFFFSKLLYERMTISFLSQYLYICFML
jgi:hypothetical protein